MCVLCTISARLGLGLSFHEFAHGMDSAARKLRQREFC
jgi:hypothetical protein